MTTKPHAKRTRAQPVSLHNFVDVDVQQEGDENARLRGYFPLSPGTPNAGELAGENLMVVSMEIAPGDYLPTHTDSNEELLIVTAGAVDATVGEHTVGLTAGECTVVPELLPHSIRSTGDEPAHVIGVFPNTRLTSTFKAPLHPFESSVITVGGTECDQ